MRHTSGALLRGINAFGPPVLSNLRHQYRVQVDTQKSSAITLIPCFLQDIPQIINATQADIIYVYA